MKRCLIWGIGKDFSDNILKIKYYENTCKIEIIGITARELYYENILDYPYIPKESLNVEEIDYVIAMATGKTLLSIEKDAMQVGFEYGQIIPVKAMSLIGFDFEKYQQIRLNPPTIFAPNCWGGITYNTLGLRFKSPFINMFLSNDDYLKFLAKPKEYVDRPLVFCKMGTEEDGHVYPIAMCGDIQLHFNHNDFFDDAEQKWNTRKQRIDWDNIFVMNFDTNYERIKKFLQLPYEKKICFLPFPMEHPQVISIDYQKAMPNYPFWKVVNGMARGGVYYDVLDLLNNKKTFFSKSI